MAKRQQLPVKKTTRELFEAIDLSLNTNNYYFTYHGKARSKSRKKVNDLEVLRILKSNGRRHEAIKDKLGMNRTDWNYHICGQNSDKDEVRISLSFDSGFMLIITVINLDEET